MSTIIKLRRDTEANWILNNPIIEEGESIIVTDPSGAPLGMKIGNAVTPYVTLPYFNSTSDSILQVVGTRANYAWGSIGHASPWALSWLDTTLVTKGKNSRFIISGDYRADDTNSSSFGMGIGCGFSTDGTNFTYIVQPAAHEQYNSVASDKYMTATMNYLTTTEVQVPRGTTLKFRLYGRFNNSNGQQFLGNGAPFTAQGIMIQEVSNVQF